MSLRSLAYRLYRKAGLSLAEPWSRRRLDALGYLSLFEHRPADAKPPVCSDLWFIYRQIRERRPRLVLEFGSGCSTYVYAQALADNAAEGAPGFLHSLDADSHWGQVTIDSMPAHLREWCEVRITPRVEAEIDGVPVWRFAEVPDVVPDFIYLDGPALTPERRAAIDVLDLEPRLSKGAAILVDGRLYNCALLEKHFTRRVAKRHNRLLKNTLYELAD